MCGFGELLFAVAVQSEKIGTIAGLGRHISSLAYPFQKKQISLKNDKFLLKLVVFYAINKRHFSLNNKL